MNSKERISRLQAEGVLSEAQANRLLTSLQATNPEAEKTPTPRRTTRWPIYAGLASVALVVVLMLLGGNGNPGEIQSVAEQLNNSESVGAMPKIASVFSLIILLLIPVVLFAFLYNGLVNREEAVFSAWSDVESTYQRRSDLIPRLVEVAGRYLKHESETLEAVVRERNSALQQAIDAVVEGQALANEALHSAGQTPPDDAQQLDRLTQGDKAVRTAFQKILLVVEDYPELRASDQLLELQAQLEGTENRINVARLRFNESVENFNAAIRRMPGSLIAGLGNFHRKAYFKADSDAAVSKPLDL